MTNFWYLLTWVSWGCFIGGAFLLLLGRAVRRAAVPGPPALGSQMMSFRSLLQFQLSRGDYFEGSFCRGEQVLSDEHGHGAYLFRHLSVAGIPLGTVDNDFAFETVEGERFDLSSATTQVLVKPRLFAYLPLGVFERLRFAAHLFSALRSQGLEGFELVATIRSFIEERRSRMVPAEVGQSRLFQSGLFICEHVVCDGDSGYLRPTGSPAFAAVADSSDLDERLSSQFWLGTLIEQFGSMIFWSGIVGIILG